MKVLINLVTWNGKKYLPYCLESIANQTFRDFSIFILDNGSTDGTVEYLKSEIRNPKFKTQKESLRFPTRQVNFKFQIPNLEIVFNDKNVGFAAGHNQLLKLTNSDYILMLNHDVILEPNFLEVIVKFMDAHPEIGAVTGKLLYWKFENNQKTNLIDSCGLKIFKNHRVVELGAGEMDSEKWNTAREVFGVSAAAPVYRRAALEDVAILIPPVSALSLTSFSGVPQKQNAGQQINEREYFDEDFFSYKEDIDLAYRLRLRGWKAWFLPEALAYHDRTAQGTAGGNYKAAQARKNKTKFVNYHSYKNHLFFLIKNVPAKIWWRYGYQIKWYEFKKMIYLLFFETATLKSFRDFFKKLPKMRKKRKYIMAHKKIDSKEVKQWLE